MSFDLIRSIDFSARFHLKLYLMLNAMAIQLLGNHKQMLQQIVYVSLRAKAAKIVTRGFLGTAPDKSGSGREPKQSKHAWIWTCGEIGA
jgi:hypothetical protein